MFSHSAPGRKYQSRLNLFVSRFNLSSAISPQGKICPCKSNNYPAARVLLVRFSVKILKGIGGRSRKSMDYSGSGFAAVSANPIRALAMFSNLVSRIGSTSRWRLCLTAKNFGSLNAMKTLPFLFLKTKNF